MVDPLIGRVSRKDLLDRHGTSLGLGCGKGLLFQMHVYSSDRSVRLLGSNTTGLFFCYIERTRRCFKVRL